MVQDLVHNLCESLVVNIGGVAGIGKKIPPTPITYLTQWKIVGNSEVHTLPYPDGVVLPTGYKRCKYLTFDGNSYIDTGIIPEQGIGVSIKFKFLEIIGDDGIFGCRVSAWSADSLYCFRQKISGKSYVSYGGKICDNTSTGNFVINANEEIELHLDSSFFSFTNGTNTLTESVSSQITKGTNTLYIGRVNGYGQQSCIVLRTFVLTNGVENTIFNGIPCLDDNNTPCLYDTVSGTSFYNDGTGKFGYELYPQPTEIWSCGEYSAVDGKYHILVKPLGGNIADIALNEPLRKVNDVADTIEFPSTTDGKAFVTRNVESKIVSAYSNTDGSQIQTTLPDTTILHVQNIISNVQAISITELTVTVNADFSLSIVGGNTGSSYIYRQIGNTNSRTSSDNYTYFSGIEGGENSTFDVRYGGNVRVTTRHSVVKKAMSDDNLFFMLRAGANVNDTFYPTVLNLNAMFSDAPSLMPTTKSAFTTMFPNIKVIPFSNDVVDVIVHDGKLYKEDETGIEILVPLATPTTELVDVPQIAEADSYSCEISQGAKAVEWTEFVANPT